MGSAALNFLTSLWTATKTEGTAPISHPMWIPRHLQRHKVQAGLLLLSYLFVVLAMARPQWGAKSEAVAERLDVMLALDISTSMLAEDEKSVRRLAHAKETHAFTIRRA